MRIAIIVVVVLVCLGLSACGGSESTPTTTTTTPVTRLQVVTTTAVLADFARVIGGEQVDVYSLLKPNVDPHEYEPTAADTTALAKADVIIQNGIGLEGWFEETMENAEVRGRRVDASVGVTLRKGVGGGAEAGEDDPHIWHSPLNARTMVTNIRSVFEGADPANAELFAGQERAYHSQLGALDREIRASISTLTNKKLVTSHDSLGYYVDEFDLDYVGSVIPGFDSQAELSPAQINDVVAKIKAQGVKAIFTETSLPAKAAEAVAQEADVKLITGEDGIYGDSLGPPESDAATYLQMLRHNTDVIVSNLR